MRALTIGGGIALAPQRWRFIVPRSRASSTRHTRHGQKIWADTGGPTGVGVSLVTGNRRTTTALRRIGSLRIIRNLRPVSKPGWRELLIAPRPPSKSTDSLPNQCSWRWRSDPRTLRPDLSRVYKTSGRIIPGERDRSRRAPRVFDRNHPAGLMFGFRRKKLSGSYFFFSAANRP